MTEETEQIEKFKKLILDMHRGFPSFVYYRDQVENLIPEQVRLKLESAEFLIKTPNPQNPETYFYMLGPSALSLVSSWKTEEMTKRVKFLTVLLVSLTFALIVLEIWNLVIPNP